MGMSFVYLCVHICVGVCMSICLLICVDAYALSWSEYTLVDRTGMCLLVCHPEPKPLFHCALLHL